MRDIPRNKGYNKVSMTKHKRSMEVLDLNANQYARMQKLDPDFFVRSFQKYFPDEPLEYNFNKCEYCGNIFAYSKKTQRFCSPKCSSDQRRDKEYFSGNRKKTVGLAERICQICGALTKKGLAAHHVYGKVSDPKGKHLVALCPGCHDLVTKLGIRTSVNDPTFWEKLIHYSKLRKNGPDESQNRRTSTNNKAIH